MCSPSHWFSGCLVFSCLGISEVKKRLMALEPVGVCAGGERQQNPALFLSIFQFSYNFIAGDSRNLRSPTTCGCCSWILAGSCITYWEISSPCAVHSRVPTSPFLFWQLSHCGSQCSSNPSLPQTGAKESLSSAGEMTEGRTIHTWHCLTPLISTLHSLYCKVTTLCCLYLHLCATRGAKPK